MNENRNFKGADRPEKAAFLSNIKFSFRATENSWESFGALAEDTL